MANLEKHLLVIITELNNDWLIHASQLHSDTYNKCDMYIKEYIFHTHYYGADR